MTEEQKLLRKIRNFVKKSTSSTNVFDIKNGNRDELVIHNGSGFLKLLDWNDSNDN